MKRSDLQIIVGIALGQQLTLTQTEGDREPTLIDIGDSTVEYYLKLTDKLKAELSVNSKATEWFNNDYVIAEFNCKVKSTELVRFLTEAILVFEKSQTNK